MRVEEFVSSVLNDSEESASAPHGQLRRHHRTQVTVRVSAPTVVGFHLRCETAVSPPQPFDEGGRRTAAPCAPPGTAGTRLFSALDDGTGFTPAEWILDAWLDEGIQNGSEILQVSGPCSSGAAEDLLMPHVKDFLFFFLIVGFKL